MTQSPFAHTLPNPFRTQGLQNEAKILTLQQKLELVEKLVAAEPASIELASFVRPDLVPAMEHGAELCLMLNDTEWALEAKARGMHFAALVPNLRGYHNLVQARDGRGDDAILDTVVTLVSCSDAHSMANVNRPLEEALDQTLCIIDQAKADGLRVQAYASLAFGCPFEGAVDPAVVQQVVKAYAEHGADVVILADTLGCGLPAQVTELVSAAKDAIPVERLGLHMHDSHGLAARNIEAGAAAGVRRFDAAVGGCGGCNFVPDAKGNISTQAVLGALESLSIPHAMDTSAVEDCHAYLESVLERRLELDSMHTRV